MTTIGEILTYFIIFLILYYQVFLLLTFVEDKMDERKNKGRGKISIGENGLWPRATIIVPCFNEGKTVSGTLDSLLSLDYPKDKLNIIAVNDGSSDNTADILENYAGKFGIKVFHKKNGGKHTALNLGIANTDSEIIGCLDADSFVERNALKEIVKKFENPETMAVTPAILVHKPENILELIQKAEYNVGLFSRKMLCRFNSLHVTPGPFSFFRREVFEKIGPYRHGHSTEDMEMTMRMQSHRMKIDNAPKAYVYTTTPRSYSGLLKQRIRWIYGFLKNAIDYRGMFFNKKYGNFGLFYLPFAFFSIYAVLYLFFMAVYRFLKIIYDRLIDYSIVGFEFSPKIDWFFVNTESFYFVGAFFLISSLLIIFIGRRMSEDKTLVGKDVLYFVLFYGLISPFWLIKAAYNVAFSKEASWR